MHLNSGAKTNNLLGCVYADAVLRWLYDTNQGVYWSWKVMENSWKMTIMSWDFGIFITALSNSVKVTRLQEQRMNLRWTVVKYV